MSEGGNIFECSVGGSHAARIIGVSCYRTLDHWIRTGLLTVSKPANGKGSHRGFSFLDLIRGRCVVHLRAQGVSLQTVRRAQAELTERYGVQDPLTQTAKLVVAGNQLFWVTDDGALLNVLKGQYAARPLVVLDMPQIVQDTRHKMAEFCQIAA